MRRRRMPTLPPPPLMGGGPTFNVIGNGRFSTALQRFLGIRGSAPAPQLSPDVVPTLEIDSDRPDRQYLLGVYRAGVQTVTPAVVGRFAGFAVFNPANSGSLIMIEDCTYSSATSAQVVIRQLQLTGAVVQARAMDGRWGITSSPTAQVSTGDSAGLPPEAPIMLLSAGSVTRIPVGIVLPPGFGMEVDCRTANTQATLDCRWTERPYTSEESVSG